MVIHIQPQERTQHRSRKRKFILERQSPHATMGPRRGSAKGAGSTKLLGGDRNKRTKADAFDMGVKMECKSRRCEGISLVHLNVTKPVR